MYSSSVLSMLRFSLSCKFQLIRISAENLCNLAKILEKPTEGSNHTFACRAQRSEARIQQMLWQVNYSDIVFVNTVCIQSVLSI